MTYIWYTNNTNEGYNSMVNQVSANSDTITDSISNGRGWTHFESVANDYIVMDSAKYANDVWDIVTNSCRPIEMHVDIEAYGSMKSKFDKIGFDCHEARILAF